MRWTINLEGGPKRVNHAACAIGDKIYSFGGYCCGEPRSRTSPVDVHVLDTNTYRWTRVFGEPPCKKIKSNNQSSYSYTDTTFSTDFDSDIDVDVEFEIEDDIPMDEEEDQEDQPIYWQYNPLAVDPADNTHEMLPEEEAWQTTPYMRYGHTVVAYNGKAYLWGGRNDDYGSSKRLYEYDPAKNSWSCVEVNGPFIPPARDGHSACLWGDKMIVFAGFEEDSQRFSQETYAFDFTTKQWSELKTHGNPPSHRDFHAACMLGDKMWVFGGRSDERGQFHSSVDFYDNSLYYLDMKTLTWATVRVKSASPPGRRSNTLWSYAGRIYMFGGYESKNNRHFADLYRFDPQDSTWTKLKPAGQSAPVARRRQCSVMVGNRLFLFGGTRPHDTHRNKLVDLGDLHVLDYDNTLFSICVDNIVRTGLYRRYSQFVPDIIREEIELMTTPNGLSRASRTSNSSG